ncbi:MAG TPA: hypothetical protein VK776_11205 [Bryobacteraceae bacterium]|jgi:hypothetical protein|nr:hypothetical protein [Bryobacteraceae bacterium]
MARAKEDTLEFLLQLDVIGRYLQSIGKEQWQILYSHAQASHSFTVWCALVDDNAAARAMEHDGWDLRVGDGRPGFSQGWPNGREITTYNGPGASNGIRHFIRYRSFNGAFPDYVELDEEFRLYHNLAEDKTRGLLLDFDASGREIEVVRTKRNEVQAQLKYLRQFQAGTRLNLAIYIDSRRFSKMALADVPVDERELVEAVGMVRWRRNVAVCDFKEGYQTFSRLLCKVILKPPARKKAGIWPFKDDDGQKAVTFIIGADEDGNDVEHTSDPDALANNFGANPGAPHYLTPVYFRREVLAKYFAEPERYKVSDGRLTCLGLWGCQIDNDLDSHIVVFLGDLGRDLPYEERLHWRQFNVPPEGRISETNFRRSFLGQFAAAEAPDLSFRQEYADIMRDWEKKHGWSLFLSPSSGDSYLLNTVRIPVTDSQTEFDQQIGHLAKLLIDSLNEKELAARAGVLEEAAKGIVKFDGFLKRTEFPERQAIIQLLRDLQSLRSTGSAHRKGSAYEKIIAKLCVDPTRKAAIRRILEEATEGLRAVRLHYCGKPERPR